MVPKLPGHHEVLPEVRNPSAREVGQRGDGDPSFGVQLGSHLLFGARNPVELVRGVGRHVIQRPATQRSLPLIGPPARRRHQRCQLRTVQLHPSWFLGQCGDGELLHETDISIEGREETFDGWSSDDSPHDHWMCHLCNPDQPTWAYALPSFLLREPERVRFRVEVGVNVGGSPEWLTKLDELLHFLDVGIPWHRACEAEWRE